MSSVSKSKEESIVAVEFGDRCAHVVYILTKGSKILLTNHSPTIYRESYWKKSNVSQSQSETKTEERKIDDRYKLLCYETQVNCEYYEKKFRKLLEFIEDINENVIHEQDKYIRYFRDRLILEGFEYRGRYNIGVDYPNLLNKEVTIIDVEKGGHIYTFAEYVFYERGLPYRFNIIKGIVSFTEIELPNFDKKIYLLGDRHIRDLYPNKYNKYIEVLDFMRIVFDYATNVQDIVIDFYLEFDYKLGAYPTDIYDNTNNIPYCSEVYRVFQNCLSEFHKCFVEHRIHGIDLRKKERHILTDDIGIDTILNTFCSKIYKQINKIESDHIKLWLEGILEDINTEIKNNTTEKDYGMRLYKLIDIYLIARIFATPKKIETRYSEEQKNIIVYLGNRHVRNIIDIFAGLATYTEENITINTKDGGSDQMVHIGDKFKQPLFSESKPRQDKTKVGKYEEKWESLAQISRKKLTLKD